MILKIDIALAAYEELRIGGSTSSATPGEIGLAVRRLDSMMLGWRNKNLCVNYNKSTSYSDIDPNQDSGLNDTDMFAVVANLAKNLCASFGKMCPQQTLADAKEGYDNLFSVVIPQRESDPYLPLGSGRTLGNTFAYKYKFQDNNKNAPDNCSTLDLKIGEVNTFPIDFNHYLDDGETILSFVITGGVGVSILSSSESDGIVTIEAKGLIAGYDPVKITITSTPNARVNPRTINFNVTST